MALEAMSLPSLLRRVDCAPPTCGIASTSLSSRNSGLVSLSADLLRSFNRVRDHGAVRCRSSDRRAAVAVRASNEGHGFFGSLATVERPCANSCPGGIGSNGVLENWLESSLVEIVRHLPEAPFLQYVCKSSHRRGADRQRVDEELFDRPEEWGPVKQCLLEAAPDGIILVHRLDQGSLSECCMAAENTGGGGGGGGGDALLSGGHSTDVWGVLVHGCSVRSNACYILRTTRVASSSGILTHFCVSRAKCFGPSLKSQMQSTWLL